MIIKRSLKQSNKPEDLSIKDFYQMRNKVLVLRQTGGIGDILMQRMMFEDFKRIFPESHITYSCPSKYKSLAMNHPFIDEWLPSEDIDLSKYLLYFNITTACNRHEMRVAPLSDKHRSDIWANNCGAILSNHNMHITIEEENKKYAQERLKELNTEGKPTVCFCPISAMLGKNLQSEQITDTVKGLWDMGLFVYSTHIRDIPELTKLKVPVIKDISVSQWMGVIDAADHVVSVDTGAFHLSGGLGKPLVGVFGWTDGKVYGRYYKFALVQRHRDDGDWDCGPCYSWHGCPKERQNRRKPCITSITADNILKATEQILDK